MVGVDIIRDLFKGVVESHLIGITWLSDWTAALDSDLDHPYPACVWKPPTTGVVIDGNISYDTFGLDVVFVDDTDSDRTAAQRDECYERMEAIARQCFYRFRQLYVLDNAVYQGVTIDLGIETSPVLSAIWDEPGRMTTGARMTVTFRNRIPAPCPDGYFS
jgi:hypothetical protein